MKNTQWEVEDSMLVSSLLTKLCLTILCCPVVRSSGRVHNVPLYHSARTDLWIRIRYWCDCNMDKKHFLLLMSYFVEVWPCKSCVIWSNSLTLANDQLDVRYKYRMSQPAWRLINNPTQSNQFSLNMCTGRSLTESDNTRCCINTIWLPDDEHDVARNM